MQTSDIPLKHEISGGVGLEVSLQGFRAHRDSMISKHGMGEFLAPVESWREELEAGLIDADNKLEASVNIVKGMEVSGSSPEEIEMISAILIQLQEPVICQ